jgi:DNA-binding SARP family transcriptional activator
VPQLLLADGRTLALDARAAALLTYLALEGETAFEHIGRLIWPASKPQQARANLRKLRHSLRQRAGVEVVAADGRVRLGSTVAHDLAQLAERIAAEPALAGHEFLANLDCTALPAFRNWLEAQRERLRRALYRALAEHIARLESAGRIAAALPVAERWITAAPFDESAYMALMRLHAARGDRAGALAAYARLCAALGTPPSAAAHALAQSIERNAPVAMALMPPATLRPPRLIGRDAEWAALSAAWRAARPVLVMGEPGIGKSRLLSDFGAVQAQALLLGAHRGDAFVPYSLLARLLRAALLPHAARLDAHHRAELARLVPELGAAPAGKIEAVLVVRAAAAALAFVNSDALPGIIVDDLHYADAASLEALALLIESTPGLRWAGGVRSSEVPAALAAWLTRASEGGPLQLTLPALDRHAVEALLRSLELPHIDAAALAPELGRHSGGNPLLLLETVRAALAARSTLDGRAWPPAAQLAPLLRERLARLSPPALRLAQLAALAGQDFSAALAVHALGVHALDLAEAWRELETAQIIRDGAFAHDLILDAAAGSLDAVRARTLHAAIAAYGAQHGAPAARIAEHWQRAQAWPAAARALVDAADAALRASRRAEEHALLVRARDCFAAAGMRDDEHAVLRRLVRATVHVAAVEAALELAQVLLAQAQSARQRAEALETRALVYCEMHRSDLALADARAAVALAAELGAADLERLAAARAASALMLAGRNADALGLFEPCMRGVDTHASASERLELRTAYATLLDYCDRRRAAAATYRRVADEAIAAADWTSARDALGSLGVSLMYLGRLEASTAAMEEARRLTSMISTERGAAAIDDMTYAGNLRDLGRFSAALPLMRATLDELRRSGYAQWAHNQEHDLAGAYLWLGQPQRGRKVLTELPADAPVWLRATRLIMQAKLTWRPGPTERALLEEARTLAAAGIGRWYIVARVDLDLARVAGGAEAAATAARIAAEALQREQIALHWQALTGQIDVLLRAGRTTEAARVAHALLSALGDAFPGPAYAPEVWWFAHAALHRAGDPASAGPLCRARDWIHDVAEHHVPPDFRDSFLHRNPINRQVLETARRLRLA